MGNKIVSIDLYDHLKASETFGVVHSKFDRSINIILHDDVLVTLLTDTKDVAPMSVVCDHKTFNALNVNVGDHITTTDTKFYLGNRLLVDVAEYVTWEKTDKSKLIKYDTKKHESLVDTLYKRIIETGKLDGIASVVYFFDEDVFGNVQAENLELERNHYVNFIIERLERFIDDYKNCDLSRIEESFVRIIGFGPGLTPSVDDFICGLFSASKNLCTFYDVSDNYISILGEKLVEKLHLKTTRISEEMIRHCFQNNISRTYDVLLTTLLYETKEDLEASISKVIEFGDTSGTDFLAGVYTACRLFEEYTIRRKFDVCKV